MHWKVGSKFLLFSVCFLPKQLGFIILKGNVNYKFFFKTTPYFKMTYKKEVFPQLYYNKLLKKQVTIVDEWKMPNSAGWKYKIYTLNQPTKQYLSIEDQFVPFKVLM